jgi:hypothetical protein
MSGYKPVMEMCHYFGSQKCPHSITPIDGTEKKLICKSTRNTNNKTFFGGREGIGFKWVNIPNIEAKL